MKLLEQLQVFAVCLVFVTSQDIEGSSVTSCRYKPYVYNTCSGSSSYCCPSISYSRSYYGTTFRTCCPYNSFRSNTRYCTNAYAARLFCNAKSMHCCVHQTYMSGGWRRGCCSVGTTSTNKCQYAPTIARTCYGTSSYCCPYKTMVSYAQSYWSSTFSSCCGRYELYGTYRRCSNKYENYWCRSPSSKCCASKTYISGSWQSGCCRSTTSYSTSWTTAKKCQHSPSAAKTCYGTSSYCCPYKSYAQSYWSSTFSSCCGRYEFLYGTYRRCSNKYEIYWCRSPSSKCCASKTYISGSWQSGCCRYSTSSLYSPTTPIADYDDGDSSRYRGPNVGAIVGGVVGGIILVVIIVTVVGVTCSKRNARRDTGMVGGTTQGPIQGYPQFNTQQVGSMPYPGYPQQGPYVIQGAYFAPGAVSYHPTAPVSVGLHVPTGRAPFNAAQMTATPAISAPAGSPPASAGTQGGAVGGSAQAQPPPEKSMLPEDLPPAYDNLTFSE